MLAQWIIQFFFFTAIIHITILFYTSVSCLDFQARLLAPLNHPDNYPSDCADNLFVAFIRAIHKHSNFPSRYVTGFYFPIPFENKRDSLTCFGWESTSGIDVPLPDGNFKHSSAMPLLLEACIKMQYFLCRDKGLGSCLFFGCAAWTVKS